MPPARALPDLVVGDVVINFRDRRVTVHGQPVKLTPVEYKLLYHLVRNAGRLMPHDALLDRVWGAEYGHTPDHLKVFISRLRSKIERPGGPHYIETERGVGYSFIHRMIGDRSTRRLPTRPASSTERHSATLVSQPWRPGRTAAPRRRPAMFTRILVPLDGSRRSERALPYAAGQAKVFGSELALIHDETVALRRDDVPASADTLGRITDLAEALQNLGLRVWRGVVHGPAAEAILRAADDAHADLIVMSTHGRGGLGRWLYGSVADEVFRHTTLPIVLISAACERRWRIEGPFRLLVPLDGSPFAEAALGLAGEVADALHAELVLLRVVEPADGFAALEISHLPAQSQGELDEAQAYLDGISTSSSMAGRTTTRRIAAGDPAATIAGVARDEDVDLIVMSTHGSGGLTRLTMGSVATSVLHRATTPLLLARSLAARRSADGEEDETSVSPRTVTVTMI